VQAADLAGLMRSGDARMMAVTGSWSGAIVGGLLFGVGMVLARGCSGRLLVLAATGNLRSLVSGLIFAVVAQMALTGWLAPIRDAIAAMWITPGGRNVDLLAGLPEATGLVIGLATAVLALVLARRNRISARTLVFGSGVGFAVAVGYVLTFGLSQIAFDPVQIESPFRQRRLQRRALGALTSSRTRCRPRIRAIGAGPGRRPARRSGAAARRRGPARRRGRTPPARRGRQHDPRQPAIGRHARGLRSAPRRARTPPRRPTGSRGSPDARAGRSATAPARLFRPPRAARHLPHQLKGPLGGAQVRALQPQIGVDHADQRQQRESCAPWPPAACR
jgi:hypothetical protein